MRKYILSIILLGIGLSILIYSYIKNNKTQYSEKLFSVEAIKLDTAFTNFIEDVTQNITAIQSNFEETNKIKDTVFTKNYFLNFMENKQFLNATILIKNATKIAIRKDGKSLIFAMDTTEVLDVVKWQRFENKKNISSWNESFEKTIDKSIWYEKIKKAPNQLQWIFKTANDATNLDLFYGAFYYKTGNINNYIIMEFSKAKLLDYFDFSSKRNKVNLWIENTQNKIFNLTTNNQNKDSLQINLFKHFKQFKNKKTDIFNFKYKNENYWNSFKRFPKKTGLFFYLLSYPNSELQNNFVSNSSNLSNWIAILFIVGGLFLLFLKKRYFYFAKRIKIPEAKEILKKDENRYLEFKSSARWDYRQEKTNPDLEKIILKTIAAFGNTDGGLLLIGVDDDKNILGLEKDFNTLKKSTADFYEIHLRNLFHTAMGVKYVSKYIRIKFETCENKNVICKIRVLATNEPLYLKFKDKNGQTVEKFFVRSGNSSQEINSIAEINDYINSRFKK